LPVHGDLLLIVFSRLATVNGRKIGIGNGRHGVEVPRLLGALRFGAYVLVIPRMLRTTHSVQHDHELRHRQRQQQRGPRARPGGRGLGRPVTRLTLVTDRPGIPVTGWDLITWTWHGHGGTFHHKGSKPVSAAPPAAARATMFGEARST
jgi:hypothetical protein